MFMFKQHLHLDHICQVSLVLATFVLIFYQTRLLSDQIFWTQTFFVVADLCSKLNVMPNTKLYQRSLTQLKLT